MDKDLEFSGQAFSKILMHSVKHPHAVCSGFLLSAKSRDDSGLGDINGTRIIDAIPISHASHCLSPNVEIAYNAIVAYAQEQELVITGYYQTLDKSNEVTGPDYYSIKIADKIHETYASAVLCLVTFDKSMTQSVLDPYQYTDGKWRRKGQNSFKIENEPRTLFERVIFSKERLYRKIVDFDDHFNDISLDWTNSSLAERIDHIIASA